MTHDALEQIGALLLAVGGTGFVLASIRQARRARRSDLRSGIRSDPGDAAASDVLWLAAASATIGAAIIHFALAPEHLRELGALGLGFLVAGGLQAASAVVAIRRRTRPVAIGMIVLNLALIAAWGWSRLVGLPAGETPWTPEAVGRPDVVTVGLEALVVVVLGLFLAGTRILSPDRRSLAASIALVPAIGLIAVATILALSGGPDTHAHDALVVLGALPV